MQRKSDTKTLSQIVNSGIFKDEIHLGVLDRILKNSTIFSFWKDIVGSKFAKFTFPYAIKNSKFYVSTKSPVIVQELAFYKEKLIKKINTYSMPLGIEIKDMVFDYKNYNILKKAEVSDVIEDKPIFYDESKLDDIKIDADFETSVKKYINNANCLSEERKKTLIKKILSAKKAELLHKKEDF